MKSEQLIKNPRYIKPHVVILGAGASRAAFPKGDVSGKQLPIMNDLVSIVRLKTLLKKYNICPSGNFENIYSNINDINLREIIEQKIHAYFKKLSLPKIATHYDRLLLSLREKDAIFTFNWDPFLFDAYQRNRNIVSLPGIFFLHGNVRIGSCAEHNEWGRLGEICTQCKKYFIPVPLLYPVENKNYYESNRYIKKSWSFAQIYLKEAFSITIFGYGAPNSDVDAVNLLKTAWLKKYTRKFERVEVIDIIDSSTNYDRWEAFTPTHHLDIVSSFEKSRLYRYPRRSCEAMFYPMTQAIPCEEFVLPQTDNLKELQNFIIEIAKYEQS